jgi:hypothetical protein
MQDIINWLNSNLNYHEGVEIFSKYCKNTFFVRVLRNGRKETYQKKLEYEMKKLLGISSIVISHQKCSNQQLINNLQKKGELTQNKKIPELILKAKEIRTDIRNQIAVMHNQLFDLGESNNEDVIKKRGKILKERKPLIEQYEIFYQLIEEYFITNIVPNNLILLLENHNTIPVAVTTTDFHSLTDIELVNMKARLSSRITKQKNMLEFQSQTTQQTPNPMPESPKRTKAEQNLINLTNDYNTVSNLIEKRKQHAI